MRKKDGLNIRNDTCQVLLVSKRKKIDEIDSNEDREFNQVITINSLLIFIAAAGIVTGQSDKNTDIPQVRSCAPEHPDV